MLPTILFQTLCLVILFQVLPFIVIPIVLRILKLIIGKSKKEKEEWKQLSNLVEEKKRIHMVDQFAKYAKIERKIKVLESKLYDQKAGRETRLGVSKYVVKVVLKFIEGIVTFLTVFSAKGEYIQVFPATWLFLLPEFIQYELLLSPPGWILLPIWILLCRMVVAKTVFFITEMLPSE